MYLFFFRFISMIYDTRIQNSNRPPLKNPESIFHKKKDKNVDESSSTFQFDTYKSFE